MSEVFLDTSTSTAGLPHANRRGNPAAAHFIPSPPLETEDDSRPLGFADIVGHEGFPRILGSERAWRVHIAPHESTLQLLTDLGSGIASMENYRISRGIIRYGVDQVLLRSAASRTLPSHHDEVISDLSRLDNGWAGPGSITPSPATIRDVESFLGKFIEPSVLFSCEVDDGDGSVCLRWSGSAQKKFSAEFFGQGSVLMSRYDSDTADVAVGRFSLSSLSGERDIAIFMQKA